MAHIVNYAARAADQRENHGHGRAAGATGARRAASSGRMSSKASAERLTAPAKPTGLSQYQQDNLDLLVVFDNRKVAYLVGFGLICFGVGLAGGLALAYQANHTP